MGWGQFLGGVPEEAQVSLTRAAELYVSTASDRPEVSECTSVPGPANAGVAGVANDAWGSLYESAWHVHVQVPGTVHVAHAYKHHR